jgi:hypothetical protein
MSFSPYDIIMGLGDSGSLATDGEQVSLDDDNMIHDTSSDFDTMSLNSETLQDFGSLVSLPPGTLIGLFWADENEDGEQTIVSSAPSGTSTIPAPVASQDIWAISPHPQIVPGSAQSICTVCTETLSYDRLFDAAASGGDENSSCFADRALIPVSVSRQSSPVESDRHDPVSFMTVANNLMRDSAHGARWFNRFTEYDWDQFRDVAKTVLSIIDSPPKSLPLPPTPPRALMGRMHTNASYEARDILPENFICTLCSDAIVGALTLDCGCSLPTVCMSCWEHHHQNSMLSNQLGFVWVEQRSCPSCHGPVTSSVPSNALDVAILHIVQSLDAKDVRACSLKHSYCSRLETWRSTVEEMNAANQQDAITRRDELLAQLIQDEEAFFWNKHQNRCREKFDARSRRILFFGQTAIALIAATLTSAGLNAIVRR